MMLRSSLLVVITFFIGICCNSHDSNKSKMGSSPLLKEVHKTLDSISNNLPRPYDDYLFTVTHQKKDGKDYIKVATAEYFNKDSVSSYELYNEHLLIFYSKYFLENQINKLDTTGIKQYMNLAYDGQTISIYHPKYAVFEILEGNKFRKLPNEEHHQKKLFYFSDRYVPEPEPNDSL